MNTTGDQNSSGGMAVPPPSSPYAPPSPSPHMPPPGAIGSSASYPIIVHYNPLMGVLMLGAALVMLLVGWGGQTMAVFRIFIPIMFAAIALGYLFGKFVIIEQNQMLAKSPLQFTVKRRPINGLADLYFLGDGLYRRSDHKKLQNLGDWASKSSDLRALKAAVAAAAPPPA